MAQGTIEMGFPTSRGREVLSGLSRVAKDDPAWSKRNPVILVSLHRLVEQKNLEIAMAADDLILMWKFYLI